MDQQPSQIKQTAQSNTKPKKLKIKVEDADSGEVYADYVTDIAIIGCVQGTREETTKPEDQQPTHVFYIGNAQQLAQMLFYIAREIGQNMHILFTAAKAKEENPNKRAD